MLFFEKGKVIGTPVRVMRTGQAEPDTGRHFDFSAISRWCRLDENPDYYNVGFQIADVTPAGTEIIAHLIENYCF